MRARGFAFALAGLVAVSCFLPDVEYDPKAGTGAKAGTGGAGGTAGSTTTGGSAGKGGTGGGTAAEGGESGTGQSDVIEETCGQYCTTYFMACEGEVANTYDDVLDCVFTCTSSGWPLGTFEEPGTIACRLTHAGRALSSGMADPHCFHSAEVPSKGICD